MPRINLLFEEEGTHMSESEFGLRSKMLVKDVMTSPVITVRGDSTVDKAAKLMRDNDIGCVIVTAENDKPVGIITDRDIVVRVVAEDIQPSKIKAKKIMSTPLITIDADKTINEAAREMNRRDVRRLAVMYRGRLVGIISSKDIISVTPELMEIMQERAKMTASEESEEQLLLTGYCDNCGSWSDRLKEVNGSYLCENCYAEMAETEH